MLMKLNACNGGCGQEIFIREYLPEDLEQIVDLFYHTVHSINIKDYTLEQVNAWATGKPDMEQWNKSLLEHYSLVAADDGRIAGFGDIRRDNYLDRLYVHKDYQGQGIASALCSKLEVKAAGKKITVDASVTAKIFFEKRGYITVKRQQVRRGDVRLTNYRMEKLCPGLPPAHPR